MDWLYPASNQWPFFDLISQFYNAIDRAVFAHREDKNILIMGGGTVDWTASTGVLDWTADIELFSPHTGFKMSIEPPAVGTFTLADGWVFYVQLTRQVGSNIVLTPQRATTMPKSDDVYLVAKRSGTQVFFRNGRAFNDGESGSIYISTSGGGAISGFSRIQATVVTNGDTWVGSGAPATAATQGGLSAGFTAAILDPGCVEVYYNNALAIYTPGGPAAADEWRWVTSGSPQPVVEIGAGSLAGDIVTVRFAN
jgi:hypothetical protein